MFRPESGPTRLAVIVLLVAGLVSAGHFLEHEIPVMEKWIETQGSRGPWIFVLLFAMLTPLFVSADALCFAAGVLFGFAFGIVWVAIATLISAALIFFIGRYLARDHVRGLLAHHTSIWTVQARLGQDSLRLMFLLRLLPLPFALLSYAFSFSPVGFWSYLLATTGIFFYHFAIVYFGHAATHFAKLAGLGMQHPFWHYALLAAGAIVVGGIVFYLAHCARRAVTKLIYERVSPGTG